MIVEEKQVSLLRKWQKLRTLYKTCRRGMLGKSICWQWKTGICQFFFFFLMWFIYTHIHIKHQKTYSLQSSKSFIGNLLHRNEVSTLDICRKILIVGLFEMSKSKKQTPIGTTVSGTPSYRLIRNYSISVSEGNCLGVN